MAILRDLLSDWPGRLIIAFVVAMMVIIPLGIYVG
jgi:hypothetical protein